jgi:hypothetical protein
MPWLKRISSRDVSSVISSSNRRLQWFWRIARRHKRSFSIVTVAVTEGDQLGDWVESDAQKMQEKAVSAVRIEERGVKDVIQSPT